MGNLNEFSHETRYLPRVLSPGLATLFVIDGAMSPVKAPYLDTGTT